MKMLKKILSSGVLAVVLLSGSLHSKGFFLGIDVGGALGALSNHNFSVSANIDPNVPPKDTMQINAGFGLNVRLGGQGYFNQEDGIRAYLSVGGVFGAPSFAFGDLKVSGITAVADVNIDYLHDFNVSENMRFGVYVGVSSGYLMTFYPGGSALVIVDRSIPRFRGITAGLNFGLRSVVANHHQFEFSTKSVFTNSVATENIFGFQIFLGANYSYIF